MITISLRRFAYDAGSRCHSLVWLRRDGDSSFIPFLTQSAAFARWVRQLRWFPPYSPYYECASWGMACRASGVERHSV